MLPKTNNGIAPCTNISSNCVVWQGPDISCIDLCTGDTVSDVVAALAQKLCDLVIPEPDSNGLDLLCVLPQGQIEPPKLKDVVQLIIDYVCNLQTEENSELPILELPTCLSPYTDGNGDEYTALQLDIYAEVIANEICSILEQINEINTQLEDHETRIQVIESCVLDSNGDCNLGGGDPNVFSTCILENQTIAASTLLLALETAFCDLREAVGTPPLVNAAINQAVCITNSEPMLSSSGTYDNITGWIETPTTLAHAVGNAWIVICDMYQAIKTIQTNCCPGPCDETIFSYETSIITNSVGNPTGVEFNFVNSNIPSGFTDCGGQTTISITDSNGVLANNNFTFSNYAGTNTTYEFNLSSSTLNLYSNLNTSISFCVTNGTDQCEETVTSSVEAAITCPTNLGVSDITEESAILSFTNTLGTSAIFKFTITDLDDGSSNNIISVSNLPFNPSVDLTGLEANTNYEVVLEISLNGVTQTCSPVTFISAETSCSNGMDVAFIMDYTGSMGDEIETLKTGFANLITTIQSSSGVNNYRLSIVTADEKISSTVPAYASCEDYTSLPEAQRLNYTGGDSHQLFITAWEMFQDNNGASATAALNKLNGGVDDTCINMGNGGSTGPECTDQAISRVLSYDFTNAWRPDVAKYIIVGTDVLPGGDDGSFEDSDWTFIQSLAASAQSQGVKIFILGAGVNATFTTSYGETVYPWQYLATATDGGFNSTFDATIINDQIIASC